MTLHLSVPVSLTSDFLHHITVIGVGGGGTNAVDNMIALGLQGVDFVVANTDAQQLQFSRADRRIQLGPHITQGLGAGAKPEIGRAAAEEAAEEIYQQLDGVHMVFITAGMGGGTGTGAAPVIARMAKERGILTVGVVTKPFTFEGSRRARTAEAGIDELTQQVDTLIVIPNQNLFRLANDRTGWAEAFKMADNVLYMGVRGITDLMTTPGLVNLDFADIRTVMSEAGKAMMGTGEADGEGRAVRAAEAAINNPLLEDTSMAGARALLVNITGGEDMTLYEVDQAINRVREEIDENANIIFGSTIDAAMTGRVRISVVATGIESPMAAQRPRLVAVGGGGMPADAVAGTELPGQASGFAGGASVNPPGTFPGLRPPPRAGFPTAPQPGATLARATQEAPPTFGDTAPPQTAAPSAPQTPEAAPAAPHPGQRNPLFSPEPQAQRATQAASPAAPARSLFGIVTDRFRRPPEPPLMPRAQEREHYVEPRASVRPSTPEDSAAEIPAFLRRQSS